VSETSNDDFSSLDYQVKRTMAKKTLKSKAKKKAQAKPKRRAKPFMAKRRIKLPPKKKPIERPSFEAMYLPPPLERPDYFAVNKALNERIALDEYERKQRDKEVQDEVRRRETAEREKQLRTKYGIDEAQDLTQGLEQQYAISRDLLLKEKRRLAKERGKTAIYRGARNLERKKAQDLYDELKEAQESADLYRQDYERVQEELSDLEKRTTSLKEQRKELWKAVPSRKKEELPALTPSPTEVPKKTRKSRFDVPPPVEEKVVERFQQAPEGNLDLINAWKNAPPQAPAPPTPIPEEDLNRQLEERKRILKEKLGKGLDRYGKPNPYKEGVWTQGGFDEANFRWVDSRFGLGQGHGGHPETFGSITKGRGTSDTQLERLMSGEDDFLGVISADEIDDLLPAVKPKSRGGFIMNTDPSTKEGTHWVACYYDARPAGKDEICYYDSYGDNPSDRFLRDIIPLVKKLNPKEYLQLKINKVVQQAESSDNCGSFCAKFLIDMFNGKSFMKASKFDDHVKGEGMIAEFNKEHSSILRGGGSYKFPLYKVDQTGGRYIIEAPKIRSFTPVVEEQVGSGPNDSDKVDAEKAYQNLLETFRRIEGGTMSEEDVKTSYAFIRDMRETAQNRSMARGNELLRHPTEEEGKILREREEGKISENEFRSRLGPIVARRNEWSKVLDLIDEFDDREFRGRGDPKDSEAKKDNNEAEILLLEYLEAERKLENASTEQERKDAQLALDELEDEAQQAYELEADDKYLPIIDRMIERRRLENIARRSGKGWRDFFTGSNKMPSKVEDWIKRKGHLPISELSVVRVPIQGVIQKGIEFLKRQVYDKVFHLYIRFRLYDNTQYEIERNQTVNLISGDSLRKNEEIVKVPISGYPTLGDFFKKGIDPNDKMFWKYSTSNNCQKFVMDLLNRNGYLTPALKTFIYQDPALILGKLTQKIADSALDLVNKADVGFRGQGKTIKNILIPKSWSKKEISLYLAGLGVIDKQGVKWGDYIKFGKAPVSLKGMKELDDGVIFAY